MEPMGITVTGENVRIKTRGEYREAVGLESVRKALAANRGFSQITCFRADAPFEVNDGNFVLMPRALNDLIGQNTVGGFWLIGHWIEATCARFQTHIDDAAFSDAQHSLEYSWLFLQPNDLSDADWLLAMRLIAEAHGQSDFILRANGSSVAYLYDAEGTPRKPMSSANEIISAFKVLTYLRSRGSTWGGGDFDRLLAGDVSYPEIGSGFAVHPATDKPTAVGPSAIAFYTAVPHCISASMFFSVLKVRRGG